MRCTLNSLVRGIITSAIFVAGINVFLFLYSSMSRENILMEDVFYFGSARFNDSSSPIPGADETTSPLVSVVGTTSHLVSVITCPGLRMKEPVHNGTFQEIKGHKTYIYSAYLDQQSVRIIGLRQRLQPGGSLTCQLWFQLKDQDPLVITEARVETLPEDHGRKFTSAFIFCAIPSKLMTEVPYAISLVTGDPCGEASNILHVQKAGKMKSKFTVCVTPFNYRYSRAYELVEMIEMNRLLGADKFVFYNHSTGSNVDQVLEMYSKEGVAEVLPWHLPMKTDTWPPSGKPEIHYFAQMASLNDCLHRHRNRSQYIVYQDLDEFIIPRKHDTWAELVHERERLNSQISGFQFKCVFFRKEWFSPAKQFQESARMYKSAILTYTLREATYELQGVRSKFIVNPRLTSTVGVHQVWESRYKIDYVSEDVASLHHYRNWEKPNDMKSRIEDAIAAEKYGSRLIEKLEKMWSKLEGVAMDINITVYGDRV